MGLEISLSGLLLISSPLLPFSHWACGSAVFLHPRQLSIWWWWDDGAGGQSQGTLLKVISRLHSL